jgi:N-methylhydantoinase A
MASLRIGVDVGGTFTDLVACDELTGTMRSCKVPTVPANPADGVMKGLGILMGEGDSCLSLAHGTTAVTNAIVERRIAPVGLVTTRGFRDVLEIARMNRSHLYRLDLPAKPDPLVPRRRRLEVTERIASDGSVLTPLESHEIASIVHALKAEGVEAVAVCLLHAYANSAHEHALRTLLQPHFRYVSVSSDINAEFREYERTCTTVLNASVMPLASRYLAGLTAALGSGGPAPPLHLLHSAGGMMSIAAARVRPLAMAMSGPAAGVAAAAHVARTLGIARGLALDMGGTTTDVCLIADGTAETVSQRRLGDFPVRLPMVGVESIGAGGGSIARVSDVGALGVGPQSAGAAPGPVCYGQGGTDPTVTDANLVVGYLRADRMYGGSIRLDQRAARRALEELGRRLGLSVIEAAHGVIEIANATMLRALRLVSVQRGYDLRQFVLIAYGGAGPVHAGSLARQCGIRRVVVPAHSGAFSALGCLVSPLRYDSVQTYRVPLDAWDGQRVEDRFRTLEAQCVQPILDDGHERREVTIERSADLRYVGQNYELEVPYGGGPAELRRLFEVRHRQLYGYATGESLECVNVRVVARLQTASPHLAFQPGDGGAAPIGEHRAFFPETGEIALLGYDRETLHAGALIRGPALVEDDWSTIVVYPGQQATADGLGNILIDVEAP